MHCLPQQVRSPAKGNGMGLKNSQAVQIGAGCRCTASQHSSAMIRCWLQQSKPTKDCSSSGWWHEAEGPSFVVKGQVTKGYVLGGQGMQGAAGQAGIIAQATQGVWPLQELLQLLQADRLQHPRHQGCIFFGQVLHCTECPTISARFCIAQLAPSPSLGLHRLQPTPAKHNFTGQSSKEFDIGCSDISQGSILLGYTNLDWWHNSCVSTRCVVLSTGWVVLT